MKKSTSQPTTVSLPTDDGNVNALFLRISDIVESGRRRVVNTVNQQTVTTFWMIGREIVQTLQGGETRAQYGNAVIADLSARLTARYGPGFNVVSLKNFR
jgi:DUF1016 N-terminal domain